jgi:hypothetical protein
VYLRLQATVEGVDLLNQSFEVMGYLRVHWHDNEFPNRQKKLGNEGFKAGYGNQKLTDGGHYLPIGRENMWENASDCSVLVEYAGFDEGTSIVTHQFKFKATFQEEFEMNYFPFDRQMCHMILNARGVNGFWSYRKHRPEWLNATDRWNNKNVCMAAELGPTVRGEYEPCAPIVRFPDTEKDREGEYAKTKPTFIVRLERIPTFYLLNLVLPTFVIGSCTLVALLPSLAEFSDRLAVTLTMLLTSVAFKLAVQTYIPK